MLLLELTQTVALPQEEFHPYKINYISLTYFL